MDLATKFFNLFKGLDRAHGVYIIKAKNTIKNKLEGKGSTQHAPPTIELWQKHLDGKQGLGIVPITDDATCRWGAIDIDIYDVDILGLVDEVEKLKLPLVVCKTKSGGAHLYLFLKEEVDAKIVRGKLVEWAVALGYPGVEIFPKQVKLANKKEDHGSWLNMPYFEHLKTSRYAYRNDKAVLNAPDFIHYALSQAVTEIDLVKHSLLNDEQLEGAPPCLQHLCSRNFPQGARNSGLFNICVFLKQKYVDEWKTRVDDFNQKYMQPPLTSAEVQIVIKQVEKKSYFYTCKQPPIVGVCNREICLTRKYGVGNAHDDIGVILSDLTKVETFPPTWIISVNGIRIKLEDTPTLLTQQSFRSICVEKLNILPNRIKQDVWEKMLRGLLDHVELIEAPEDASPTGQLLQLVEEYFHARAHARTREELLIGKPWTQDGYTYFKSIELLKYLGQRHFKEVEKANKVWTILREKGAVNRVFSINGKSCRVWGMPEFKQSLTELETPDVSEKEEY